MTGADSTLFINRELSWLAFNERVLEEAADPTTPLLERLKFAAIAASNLDEFFMVRVAGLRHALAEGDTAADLAGLPPARQLAEISDRTHRFVSQLYQLLDEELWPALTAHEIRLLASTELTDVQRAAATAFFRDGVFPVLTPLAIDVSRPFPLLTSLSLNLAVLLAAAPGDTESRLAIVQVPLRLPRLVPIPGAPAGHFILLEEVIRQNLADLFPGQTIVDSTAIRLARDAELDFDDEGGRTHLELVEREVLRRRRNEVVRLEIETAASETLVTLLRRQLEVADDAVYACPGPLDLRLLTTIVELPGHDELRDPPLHPVNVLAGEQQDLFAVLDQRDVLLHHPYDAYDPVIALLARAADDPEVLAIKQTLYRASAGSSIIGSLQRAAERNKQVTVLVELTARFDEERNIQWARALEEAGAHVIYGVRGYKVHAKICLVVRRTAQGLRRYVHLGTGNYNERTARGYTDYGLLTSDSRIAEDAAAFFSSLTGYSDPPQLKALVMAPTSLRRRLLRLIERERRRAASGQPAEIIAKMNSLIDAEIIDALYAASQAGVRIRLNVRGICALRPGLPDASANIEVVSIVDRFLEHSRVFYFLNNGDEDVYLSSADWMTRNLDRRVEIMFPVIQADDKGKLISALRAMFRDNVKSRWLGPDGAYQRHPPRPDERPFRVQQELQVEARRLAAVAQDAAGIAFRPEQPHRPR